MKTPKRIQPLIEDGLIDEVIRPLMSGKEATVYVVLSGAQELCAKVYKEAATRSFKQAAHYQEGRKVRNSRRQRAMEKGSRFGREQQEQVWHTAEADALFRLADAGVRVPKAYGCFDGVLLMELIKDEHGEVAPRLNDITLQEDAALKDHATVMQSVLRMLCVGLVHGDLSEFNVLQDELGPVIIDLPQAVNAAGNNQAWSMLKRDVTNMTRYYAQYAPQLAATHYAEEIWSLFEQGELHPDYKLTGEFDIVDEEADLDAVLSQIKAAWEEEQERRQRMQDGD